jgi:hypothetical protein
MSAVSCSGREKGLTHGLSPCLGTHGQIAEGTEKSVKARLDPRSEPALPDAGSPLAHLEHDFGVLDLFGLSSLHPVMSVKTKKPLGQNLCVAPHNPQLLPGKLARLSAAGQEIRQQKGKP